MSTVRIQLPNYHPAQMQIVKNLNRFNVLDCGRRFGKDVIERNYAMDGILAGEPVSWYEPTFKSLMENWSWFTDKLSPIIKRKSEVEHRIDILSGGYLEMWSLQDKEASRGRHYKRAVVNEAAFVPDLSYSWDKVIRITLADLQGGAMIGGTPKGRNYFWNLYTRGLDPNEKDWSSWMFSTYDNPHIAKTEIDELKRTLPEIIFRQEILAEFIDDQGSVFRRIQEAAILDPLESPIPNHQYVAGVDVAAAVDYTVVTVLDVAERKEVYKERFNRVDYPVLVDRLANVFNRWGLYGMTIEANSIGQPVIDYMGKRGIPVIPFTTTSATKQMIIQGLQSAFENSNIQILNDPVTIGELLSFEGKRSPSGGFSYSAPDGMHDDCVMSLAIAWHSISGADWLVS